MWPQPTSWGNVTWVYARYSPDSKIWFWLDDITIAPPLGFSDPVPFLPVVYNLQNNTDFGLVFDDFLQLNDLYNKPVFGDCIWSASPINQTGNSNLLSNK
jgi:hypothetical protein